MKSLIMVSLSILLGQMAFAGGSMHDGAEGICQAQAQKALVAVSRINHTSVRAAAVLLDRTGPVEVYTEGGPAPQYRIVTNSGTGDGTCVVEIVQFNPEP